MIKKLIKKLSQLSLAFLVMIAPALSSMAPSKVYAKASGDNSSYDSIAEIYNTSTEAFKTAELTSLFQKLAHSSNTGEDLYDDLVEAATAGKTAAQIRTSNSNKDVNVTFGGLEWTVTYLSTDDHGKPIATLWLANRITSTVFKDWNNQDMQCATDYDWEVYDAVAGVSAYASGWWSSSRTAENPGNMYSTSFIRSLMIGSQYVQGYTDSTKTTKADNSIDVQNFALVNGTQASIFAPFTSGRYSSYIVEPSRVSWQRSGLHASDWSDWDYDLPNDTYEASTNTSVNGYKITATGESGETYYYYTDTQNDYTQDGNNMNYSMRSHYGDWKTDKLWLPSLTEVGYADSGTSGVGLWVTSQNQRMLGMGDDEDYDYMYDYSWLRSGDSGDADNSYYVYPAGNFDGYNTGFAFALRPALHLNLRSAAVSGGIKTTVFPNTGVSARISAVIIALAGVFVIGLLGVIMLKPTKKIIIK